jgi:hypothetical protein
MWIVSAQGGQLLSIVVVTCPFFLSVGDSRGGGLQGAFVHAFNFETGRCIVFEHLRQNDTTLSRQRMQGANALSELPFAVIFSVSLAIQKSITMILISGTRFAYTRR